ncbi:PQQ-binding-like beta-propeller repeat protein [Halomicrococcus sp. NG-SE-24]|uniref:outer membrane protein assembly factor BamB family protein n=1 Tax=Halomicrococcus sp. NG-SE-24 TaxID=3436928 RepID=UPI003D95C3B7
MSDRDYSEKRRTFLKTVGVTLGTVTGSKTRVAAETNATPSAEPDVWRGVRSGPSRRGTTHGRGPAPFPEIDWKMDLAGSMYDVEPLVADETVYLAATTENDPSNHEGYVGAYDSQTGDRQWKRSDLPAPKTPSLEDGTLYVATEEAETASTGKAGMYAIDADTGTTEWQVSSHTCATPVTANGIVYTATKSGAVAVDAETGEPVWQVDDVGGVAERAEGALSYTDGMVFFSDGTALDADTGSVEWEVDGNSIIGNNVAGDDFVYYIRTDYIDGEDDDVVVEARSMATGQLEWRHDVVDPNRWDGRLALADGHLFLLDSSNDSSIVKALDANTGTVAWTQTTHGELRSDPTVADGRVYVGGWYVPKSTMQAARALVYAFDVSTGRREWTYLLDDDGLETSPENPPAAGTPVVVDDKLYVATYPGESTLDYRYVDYSNFYALCSTNRQPDSNRRLPTDPPDDSDQCPALQASIDAVPALDSAELSAGDTLTLDASNSTGQQLAYKWDTNDDGRYDRFGSSVFVALPHTGSVTIQLQVSDRHDQRDTTTIELSPPE